MNPTGTPTWIGSEWGACTMPCEGGWQVRSVTCRTNNGTVADSFCFTTKPEDLQRCNQQACNGFSWVEGGFGACSVACGGGSQAQTITCRNASGALAADTNCSSTRPGTTRSCNASPCEQANYPSVDVDGKDDLCLEGKTCNMFSQRQPLVMVSQGFAWRPSPELGQVLAVGISGNGRKIMVGTNAGPTHLSADGGQTWYDSAEETKTWSQIAISED